MPPIPPPTVIYSRGVDPAPHQANTWADGRLGCALAVGNFDGVHRGHAAIAIRLRSLADRLGVPAVALTFDPHPAALVRPEAAPASLTTPRRRAELLTALGVDVVLVQHTTPDLIRLPADRFFADILRDRLGVRGLVEGEDFRFGAGRTGDVGLLRGFCQRDGIALETVAPVMAEGQPVSSSRLRSLITAGDVRGAGRLLTAPYRLTGRVVHGQRRGAALGFPTANLDAIATLLPAVGVYAAQATVAGTARFPAAVHVGPNSTFGEARITVEAHLIDAVLPGPLYGNTLDVDFLDRLRDTRKFDSVDALKAQLEHDVAGALFVARSIPPAS